MGEPESWEHDAPLGGRPAPAASVRLANPDGGAGGVPSTTSVIPTGGSAAISPELPSAAAGITHE